MSLVTIYWPSSVTHTDMAKIRKRFGITAGVTIWKTWRQKDTGSND